MPIDRFLGLDFGEKRIGYSISDDSNTIAFGKGILSNDNKLFYELKNIIISNNITHIILGFPIGLSGLKTKISDKVEIFKNKLETYIKDNQLNSEVILFDERFTSKMAKESLLMSGMKKKKRQNKENLDIVSAALLLQSYLDMKK